MRKKEKRAFLIGAGEMTGIGIKADMQNGVLNETVFREGDMVIALDGGLLYCVEHNIVPDYIIGDFDSLPEERMALLDKYPQEKITCLPKEKDDTDMLFAIKFAIAKGVKEFVIYGGLGGRLSHSIANIQCLMYLKEQGMSGILVGADTKVFLLQNETYSFAGQENGYISLFAYSKQASGVTLKNLKYEITDAFLTPSFPIGVSNEFLPGKSAQITVKDGVLLVVQDR